MSKSKSSTPNPIKPGDSGLLEEVDLCKRCAGTGKVTRFDVCPDCKGEGRVGEESDP